MKFIRHANDALYQAHHIRHAPAKPLNPAVEAFFQQVQANPHAWLVAALGALLMASAVLAVIRK
jgi:hypothetical protein